MVSQYAVSIYSLIARINCFQQSTTECDVGRIAATMPSATIIVASIALFMVLWAFFMAKRFLSQPWLAYTPMLSLAFLIVPEAATYNLIMVIPISALAFRYADTTELFIERSGLQRKMYQTYATLLCFAVVVSLIPVPIWSFPKESEVLQGIQTLGPWRFSTLAVPVVWVCVVIFSLFIWRSPRRAENVVPASMSIS
jgi:hypothetical protein